jgi:CheY-like chemotaxis protein
MFGQNRAGIRENLSMFQAPFASPPRILVVEDESTLALLLSETLRDEGFAPEVIERGDAVVAAVRAAPMAGSWSLFLMPTLPLKEPRAGTMRTAIARFLSTTTLSAASSR